MSVVVVVFWVVLNLFDFITDLSLAISLLSEGEYTGLVTMGAVLMAVSVIGVCLGIAHTIIMRDHDSDDDHCICSLKMIKIWIEDIPSMIISCIIASGYAKDCGQVNWLGIDAYTQVILTSIASTLGMVFTIIMECCYKAIKDDDKEVWQKVFGCFGALIMSSLVVVLWIILAGGNFGCDEGWEYSGWDNSGYSNSDTTTDGYVDVDTSNYDSYGYNNGDTSSYYSSYY